MYGLVKVYAWQKILYSCNNGAIYDTNHDYNIVIYVTGRVKSRQYLYSTIYIKQIVVLVKNTLCCNKINFITPKIVVVDVSLCCMGPKVKAHNDGLLWSEFVLQEAFQGD